ncbi:MAG: PDZ domain-containing protein [Alphaproteobacteria bacterium]|nr:PDZ domain-containing protein [Alphaproteobacteria bacterium]
MRLKLDRNWLTRLPRGDVFAWVELLLLALIALQLARIVWAVVTPVGTFGDWRPRQADIPAAETRTTLLSSFDPFFRMVAPGGDQVVTALDLKLFGTRLNEGSGGGSAIIATPDDMQASFAPGDEILPGVTLKSVAFDHVVIDRGGREETLFLDQSSPAPVAQPEAGPDGAPGRSGQGLTPDSVQRDIAFAPRTEGGRVTGLAVSPSGTGAAFQTAGFRPGDVIIQVNGRAIASAADIQTLTGQLAPGSRISLQVERGANVVPIAMILSSQ